MACGAISPSPAATYNAGISINEDGGNNVILKTTNGGDIFGGITAMTIEIMFKSSHALGTSFNFFNYYALNVDAVYDDIEIMFWGTGSYKFLYFEVQKKAMYNQTYDASQLLDNHPHQISFTWDSANGDWEFFCDGKSEGGGTNINTGATLPGGGTLVLGNDQDSLGGDYDNTRFFDGTFFDVRIFNYVRSPAEISSNVLKEVDSSEPGLIADWKMNDLIGGTTTSESVSGNDLVVENISGTGWTNSTPVLVLF